MAAIGKTRDLFEAAPSNVQPQSRDSKEQRQSRSRPTLKIAPAAQPQPSNSKGREELWLAISFPQLPLEALTRNLPEHRSLPSERSRHSDQSTAFPHITREVKSGSRRPLNVEHKHGSLHVHEPAPARQKNLPIVIVDLTHNQQRVIACNQTAAQTGIVPGIGVNAAYAFAGELQVLARDLEAEQRLLETLAQWAGCFTSKVTLEAPDALLLEIKGSLKLFGGLEALQGLISTGLQGKGVQSVMGTAPTPSAALIFSRTGPSLVCLQCSQLPAMLGAIPIATLRWPEEVLETLSAMGAQRIGDCLRLPREGFARRFGPQLLLQLDQLLGRAAHPQRNFIARERFSIRKDFEVELEGHAQLLLHLSPLLQSLEKFLRPRQSGVQSLELRLRHREQAPTGLVLRFLRPMADAAHAIAILTERMERLELPAPVIAARLRSGPLWPLEMETIAHRLLTDAKQAAPQSLMRLIERLRARLGAEAVYGLHCVAEHRPELASQTGEPVIRARVKKSPANTASKPSALPRPFWLLPEPQLLQTQRSEPQFEGRLEFLQGPERIESGWWDGNDISRDYYIAQTRAGLRIWLYRERKSKQWFLHGIYG